MKNFLTYDTEILYCSIRVHDKIISENAKWISNKYFWASKVHKDEQFPFKYDLIDATDIISSFFSNTTV